MIIKLHLLLNVKLSNMWKHKHVYLPQHLLGTVGKLEFIMKLKEPASIYIDLGQGTTVEKYHKLLDLDLNGFISGLQYG